MLCNCFQFFCELVSSFNYSIVHFSDNSHAEEKITIGDSEKNVNRRRKLKQKSYTVKMLAVWGRRGKSESKHETDFSLS